MRPYSVQGVPGGFALMFVRAIQIAVENWRRGYSILERPGAFDGTGAGLHRRRVRLEVSACRAAEGGHRMALATAECQARPERAFRQAFRPLGRGYGAARNAFVDDEPTVPWASHTSDRSVAACAWNEMDVGRKHG